MFTKMFKAAIVSVIVSFIMCFGSLAADRSSFPFEINFDGGGETQRICYAGHSGDTVRYKEGIAVLPDTYFSISRSDEGTEDSCDVSRLSAEISLIYENDTYSGSYTETIRSYREGDLNTSDSFQIFSDNIIASLEERDRLYSGQLEGVVMTFSLGGRKKQKETIYLYVCDEDDYYGYLDS